MLRKTSLMAFRLAFAGLTLFGAHVLARALPDFTLLIGWWSGAVWLSAVLIVELFFDPDWA